MEYSPDVQGLQGWLLEIHPVPGAQDVHRLSPVELANVPVAQILHVAPTPPADILPDSQTVHTPGDPPENRPGRHSVHVSSDTAATAVDEDPVGQLVHAPGPVGILYVPGTHATHVGATLVLADGCVYPELHRHCSREKDSSGELANAGHDRHAPMDAAPAPDENEFA